MQKITPFKFSLLPGDLIYSLAGIKHVCNSLDTKAMIYLGLNIEWGMAPDVSTGRESKITLTEDTMRMLRPLLMSQPYIAGVESLEEKMPKKFNDWVEAFKTAGDPITAIEYYNNQPHDIIDLDKAHLMPIGIPFGNIARWQFYTYPDLACDLSKRWIDVSPNDTVPEDIILVNRTERARNEGIDYSFLSKYKDRIIFVGLEKEWRLFQEQAGFKCARAITNNFLELAQLIASCSFFIGNQSLCFSIAEAMKIPRILEICPYMPNVIPCGENAFDFYFQSNFEFYVERLANRK